MMTRKRILNITTHKKKDNLLTAHQLTGGEFEDGPQFVIPSAGLTNYVYVFSPTMRWQSRIQEKFDQDNQRANNDTFASGFKERIRFITSDGNPWVWRRICFSYYDAEADFKFFDTSDDTEHDYPPFHYNVTNGYRRLWQRINGPAPSIKEIAVRDHLYEHVFAGTRNVDWSSEISAPTNSRAVKIWYDKTTRIVSGNELSTIRNVTRWHPIKKRLIYQNRDQGGAEENNYLSQTSRSSMGDYIVMDIFHGSPADSNVQLSIGSDATYYWHER